MAHQDELFASFSTSVIPSKPGAKGSFSIPLGFIISPFASSDDETNHLVDSVMESDMYLCTQCLSYLNLYCPFDSYTGKWKCSICKADNMAPNHVFTSKAFSKNIVDYRQRVDMIMNQSNSEYVSIDIKGLSISDFSTSIRSRTMIVMDGNLPSSEAAAVLKYLGEIVDRDDNCNYGLIVFSKMIHIYQTGLRGLASADVYSPLLDPMESGVHEDDRMYWGSWDGLEYCASVVFGVSESEKLLGDEKGVMYEENSESTFHSPTTSRMEQLRLKREARLRRQRHHSVHEGASPANDVFNIERSVDIFRRAQMKSRLNQPLIRCTGEAVAYATRLLEASRSATGRILIFTNGCCNSGKASVVEIPIGDLSLKQVGNIVDPDALIGASNYFLEVGGNAFQHGIGIDVFCSGNGIKLGAQSLLSLTRPSSGYVLNHNSFDSVAFMKNLSHVYTKTFMSRSKLGDKVDQINNDSQLNGCFIDVRFPSFITPTCMHGQCEQLLEDSINAISLNELSIYDKSSPKGKRFSVNTIESTRCRFLFGRHDSKSSLSIIMQVKNKISLDEDTHAHFQFIAHFLDPNDRKVLITRVISQRIPIARSDHEIFETLNEDVISVLLGKEAAFRCMVAETKQNKNEIVVTDPHEIQLFAEDVQNDIDATVYSMIKACEAYKELNRHETEQSSSNDGYAIHPNLYNVIRFLHLFRRGDILGQAVQSSDDRTLLRDAMLRFSTSECLYIMGPSLWRCNTNGTEFELKPIPAETLLLWDKVRF